ncbi:MAG: hypothetical protein ACQESG_00320 [Nanobdellota archaeon]
MKVRISNNMIAALAIALMISSITLNWTIISTRDHLITGKAVSTGTVSLCYNHPPLIVHDCPGMIYQGESYQCDLNIIDPDCRESCLRINTTMDERDVNLTIENTCARTPRINTITPSWDTSANLREIRLNQTVLDTNVPKQTPVTVDKKLLHANLTFHFSENISRFQSIIQVQDSNRTIIIERYPNKTVTRQIQDCPTNYTFNVYSIEPLDSELSIEPDTGFVNFTLPLTTDDTFTRNNPYTVQWYGTDGSECQNHLTIKPGEVNVSIRNHPPEITIASPQTNITVNETDNQTFFIRYRDFELENADPTDDKDLTITWYDGASLLSTYTDSEYTDRSSTYVWETNHYSAGNHTITANVSDGHYSAIHRWQVLVLDRNRPPLFTRPLPNQTWQRNRIRAGFILDDYTEDPDLDDSLTYSVEYASPFHAIDVTIDEENTQAIFSQPRDWIGTEEVRFHVQDQAGARDTSNWITLEVAEGEQGQTEGSDGEDSGEGAGGGGGAMPQTGSGDCEPVWFCGDWSHCNRSNVSSRICYDLAECGTDEGKPLEFRRCTYIPACQNGRLDQAETEIDCGGPCKPCYTCYDRVKNQGEEGIDCGGPCEPCPTCDDGMQNQEEEGVDCGGPCDPCETCDDGRQNQGEEGVDCGGPCPKCSITEEPAVVIKANIEEYAILIATVIGIMILGLIGTVIISHKKTIIKEVPVPEKKQPSIDHVSKTFKDHIQEALDTDEQLTYEEMEERIKDLPPEKQTHIKRLLEQLSEIEYAGKEIDQSHIDHLHHELTLALTAKDKDEMETLAEHIEVLLKTDHLDEARKLYKELSALYEKADIEKKKRYFKKIGDLFEQLK